MFPILFTSVRHQAVCHVVLGMMLAVSGLAEAKPWTIVDRWRTTHGLPQNSINQVTQTPDGYVWIATSAGVTRFDGRRFTVFNRSSHPALPVEQVGALAGSPDGGLLIGTETGWVFSFDGTAFEEKRRPDPGQGSSLIALETDEHGDIWMLDREGVMIRVRDGHRAMPTRLERNPRGPTLLVRDQASGRVFVLHLGRAYALKNGELAALTRDSRTPLDVAMIGPARAGGILLIAGTEILHLQRDTWSLRQHTTGLPEAGFTSLTETADGRLAVGTSTHGIVLLGSDGEPERLDAGTAVADNWIRCLFADGHHSLWAGTARGGLVRLRPTATDLQSPPAHWDQRPFKAVTPRRAGGVWAGTEGDGVYAFTLERGWQRLDPTGLSNLYVWTVLEDRQGRLWAGTWGGGLFRFDGTEFLRLPGLEDPTASIACLLETDDGTIWVGTTTGLWIVPTSGAPRRLTNGPGEQGFDIRSLAAAPGGGVWVGLGLGGLARCDGERLHLVKEPSPLREHIVTALLTDESEGLWIATLEGDLLHLRNGILTAFSHAQGLPAVTIHHLLRVGSTLWLSTTGGVFSVPFASLRRAVAGEPATLAFSRIGQGTPANFAPLAGGAQQEACLTNDGIIWVASTEGLLRHNPAVELAQPTHAPRIEELIFDGRSLPLSFVARPLVGMEIPPGVESFAVRFSVPFYEDSPAPPFRFRLNDGQSPWSSTDFDWTAEFVKVPPGEYRFEIRTETGEAALPIALRPYWWQVPAVRYTAVAALAALLAGAVHLRARAVHERRTREIRRERALERERTRIARDIHDDLGTSLTRIQLLTETMRREQVSSGADPLLAKVSHLVREATGKMDEIVWAVSPKHDSTESVADYLCSFAQSYLNDAGIRCRLDVPVNLPRGALFASARHQVFLAFREALTNVIKHARATKCVIRMRIAADHLTIDVEDDGVGGVDAADPNRQRTGLDSMHARLAAIGGTCEIASVAPPGGTCVRLGVPLQHPAFPPRGLPENP